MKRIMLLAVLCIWLIACVKVTEIDSFEDCVNAGNPVMESYPRQCRTQSGKLFVEEVDDELIGGQRDEHGCLGPAGYSWDEEIGACTRSWEIEEEELKLAAKTAVEYVNSGGSEVVPYYTVSEIETKECSGCYDVYLSYHFNEDNQGVIRVTVTNWEATEEEFVHDSEEPVDPTEQRHFCTDEEKAAEICTMDYTPVCGDNGVTYGNSCGACASGDIGYWVAGECKQENLCTEEMKNADACIDLVEPVCGDDGKTYSNSCYACISGNVEHWEDGPCVSLPVENYCTEEQKQAQACTQDYNPVCGDNGITYGNACSACASGEVDSWMSGEC